MQAGARRHGIAGIHGNDGTSVSAICRIYRVVLSSNPTLSANSSDGFGESAHGRSNGSGVFCEKRLNPQAAASTAGATPEKRPSN